MSRISFIVMGLLSVAVGTTSAGVIPDLFDTGVNASGAPLPDGTSPDPHYTIVANADGSVASTTTVKTSASGYPVVNGVWIGDNSTSAWIMPSAGYPANYVPAVDYDYLTTFDLPADANSVTISASLSVDDYFRDILLNGVSLGFPSYDSFTAYFPVTFTSSDVAAGTNTLTFLTSNALGPAGFRVDGMTGTYTTAVPEPSAALAIMPLAYLLLSRRRSKICAEVGWAGHLPFQSAP